MISRLFLKYLYVILFSLSVAVLLSSCSSMTAVSSRWQNDKASFDKNDSMWKGNMLYFPDEKVSIGIKNDRENLYLCFKTADPATLRKAMSLGLTIWLNNTDDKTKAVGIRYPEAFRARNTKRMIDIDGSDKQEFENKNPDKNKDVQDFKMPAEMMLMIGEDQDKKKMSIEEARNKYKINISLRNDDDVMYYQLSIPMAIPELNYSFIPKPGRNVGIGIETGEFKKPDSENFSPNGGNIGMPGGGSGGMGGGYPGGMGGMGGGRRGGMGGGGRGNHGSSGMSRESMESLKLWLSVEMAKK